MMNKPAEAVETVPFKNGTTGTILVYLFPIHFEENAGKRLVGCVAIDITAKTKAEEALRNSERNLKAIFSSTKDAFFLLDKSLNVVAFNREAEEWFRRYAKGHGVQEAPDPISFLPQDRQLLVRSNMEKVLRGAGIEYEVEYGVEDDHAWFNAVMQPVVSTIGDIDGVCISITNITAKKLADKQIKETAEQLTNIMETISDGMFILNDDLTVKYMNRSAEELLQVDRSSFVGKHKDEVLSFLGANGDSPETHFTYIDKALQKRKAISFTEYYEQLHSWFEGVIYPIGGGLTIYFRDVTERKRQDMMLRLEKEVLEMNAIPESTLENTVQHFLKGLENIHSNIRSSVLLLQEDKKSTKLLAAPGMPKEFIKAIDGMPIGPRAASCGTAMFRKRSVFVGDIEHDPLWAGFKQVAIKNKLHACWSIPIISAGNEVLGSFAVYNAHPKEPSTSDMNLIERASNILRVIIENKLSEEQIRMSNKRYHFVTKATNEAIWDLDLVTNNIYWAEGYHTLFGYDPSKVYGSLAESQLRVHPSDLERIEKSLKSFLRKKTRTKWEDEYRYLKADGSYAYVLDKAYLIHDNRGNPIRLIGSMQDITTRKELEQRLLEQEIGKQRLLTQATIDGQEKERKEIGKELHDNINQILSTTKLYLDLAENTASGQTAEMIGMGSKNIMEAINEIRKLSRSLVPPTLGDLGLIESVRDLCENFSNTRTFGVKFEHRNIREKQLADNQKLMLFRIIQEQTNNIVKHAKAKNVIISLRASKGSINLEITDDGQGFNLKKTKKSVGLTNIINRAELFNGKVDIITAPKKGCTIKVSIPLATKI
jgi:PAS domain S-box-containing protein